jgi:glycosyltransferase involved in cell wall biosynthesis
MDGGAGVRVLFLTDSLSDLDGVGRYAMRLIAAMEALSPGLQVHVLLARKHRPTSDQVPDHWTVEVALPPDYFFYMSPARYWIWRAIGSFKAWRAARRADLVHAIKDFPHSQVALDAARWAGKPCIATAHGTYTIQPLLSEQHGKRARRVYRGFASMVSVSNYTRRRLLELMPELDAERVAVIPNCVSAEHYLEPRELADKPWHGKRFTLGIGEIKERKGHHLALAAWCRVAAEEPDLHHFLVGRRGGDDYECSLVAMATEAGVAERLHLVGNLDEDEKIDLLQRAQVFVHTPVTASDGGFEGFGIVYLEASASGTAVIGTLDCGAEDAIVEGRTGRLVAQDPDAVEVALRELLGDDDLRASMGEAGREHAAGATWEQNAARVLELYDQALGTRGG